MNTYNYIKIKERANLFQSDDCIPINLFSQNIYSGVNAFNLTIESKFHNKVPVFLTPRQVSKLGGMVIPPTDFFFRKDEIKKYLPDVTENNIERFRKQIFSLYNENKISNEENIPGACFKLKGGIYFDVFIRGTLKKPIFIDNRSGLTSTQIESFSKMDFEEIKKSLDEIGVSYFSSPNGIDKNFLVTLTNVSSINSYKVVSTDDVYGINLENLQKNYIKSSKVLESQDRNLKVIIDNIISTLSNKFKISPEGNNSLTPSQLLISFLRTLSKNEVEKFLTLSKEPVLHLNKNLFIELTANRIFNCLGLYGLDKSIQYFFLLLQNTPSLSLFKQNHILLQSASYSIANSILKSFDFKAFKNQIDSVVNLSTIKFEILKNLQEIADTNFYGKCSFSGKGNLTIYDFHKINYQSIKIGLSSSFDKLIEDIFNKYNFKFSAINTSNLKNFITLIGESEKKSIKREIMERYYELKAIEEKENYLIHVIDFQKFDKKDFYAFLAQNSINDITSFLYTKLDNEFVRSIENTITDLNKITFHKEINNIIDDLYHYMKSEIPLSEIQNFNKGNKNEINK